jgi:hypothetical protein
MLHKVKLRHRLLVIGVGMKRVSRVTPSVPRTTLFQHRLIYHLAVLGPYLKKLYELVASLENLCIDQCGVHKRPFAISLTKFTQNLLLLQRLPRVAPRKPREHKLAERAK